MGFFQYTIINKISKLYNNYILILTFLIEYTKTWYNMLINTFIAFYYNENDQKWKNWNVKKTAFFEYQGWPTFPKWEHDVKTSTKVYQIIKFS